ncbi:MAG TPA: SRPBCC family protein [Streptosporangiaceae bacterium]|jgi:uncharacterized membrane protein
MASNSKASPVTDKLKSELTGLIGALGDRAVDALRDQIGGMTDRLADYVADGAGPGLMAAVTGAKDMAEGKGPVRSLAGAGLSAVKEKAGGMLGQGGGGKGKNLKVTNIVEAIDVGVPVTLAYNQWTQFADFPSFMKKVENVEQEEDQTLSWKAQIFWSHRSWESTILSQVPDERIVWRSKGEKGHVDGSVTFHELAPRLTRILMVLEYHPQGFFEHTGNLWRAPGRRARLELKHFRRHVMSQVLLQPDELQGWRGVIEDGEVVQDHEAATADDHQQDERSGDQREEQERGRRERGEVARRRSGRGAGEDRDAAGRDQRRPSRSRQAGERPQRQGQRARAR